MARFDMTGGPGSDLVWADFHEAFDLGRHRVLQMDNPGSLGGHDLGDTITETRHGTTLISNFRDLVLNEDGGVVGGELTDMFWLIAVHNGVGLHSVTGLHAQAADLYQASLTLTAADDQALWMAQLAGHDVFNLSAFGDTVDGFDGDDRVNGNGGADVIHGGAGDDRLFGNDGDDQIFGDDGNDSLRGGAGDDTLYGGTHAFHGDTMMGGSGEDHFVFGIGNASVYVRDFRHGVDKLVIDGGGTIGFADLGILKGSSATSITAGETHITLDYFTGHHLDASDFIFL